MSESPVPQALLTVEEYLEFEKGGGQRHEYVGGRIYAHAGGTSRHNAISVNLLTALWEAARGGPCRVYGSDMMLRATEEVFYYPDVTVVCGEDEAGEDALYQEAPCLLVKVTSPSTEATDRREKMLAYKSIPSLRAYLVVDQRMMRVERHWRDDAGRWWYAESVGRNGVVPVPCPETEIPLPRIYEGLRDIS
jgi:Uma2 family endonuclease